LRIIKPRYIKEQWITIQEGLTTLKHNLEHTWFERRFKIDEERIIPLNINTMALYHPNETKTWSEINEEHKKELKANIKNKIIIDEFPSFNKAITREEYDKYIEKIKEMNSNKSAWKELLNIKVRVPLIRTHPEYKANINTDIENIHINKNINETIKPMNKMTVTKEKK